MSTPNPTHIDVIARALADTADDGCFDNPPCCENPPCSDMCDGDLTDLDEWRSGEEDRGHWTKLARASVSELTDAGYSIMQLPKADGEQTWDIEAFTVFAAEDDEGVRVGIDEYDNHSGAERGVLSVDPEYARRLALALLAATGQGSSND